MFSLDADMIDPQYNYDFTDLKDDNKRYQRGERVYMRPYGWNRIALAVKFRYEGIEWLGENDGKVRTESKIGEWPVSYHGTEKGFAEEIVKVSRYSLDKGKRFMYGRGIYSTPDPTIAEKYAKVFVLKDEHYKVIIQNRVNMDDTKFVPEQNYFVTAKEENIRPYGLLYKKIMLKN